MTVVGSLQPKVCMACWIAAMVVPVITSAQAPGTAQKQTRQAEAGLPYVDCYAPEEYNGAAQTWVFEQDDRGVLYAGNNIGVLEFDGSTWRHITVGKGDVVRALDRDSDGDRKSVV